MQSLSECRLSGVRIAVTLVGLTITCTACGASADATGAQSVGSTPVTKVSTAPPGGPRMARGSGAPAPLAGPMASAGSQRTSLSDGRGTCTGRGGGPTQFLARWDTDGDGSVAFAELPVWLQSRKKAADTNADGILTRDEIQADCAARADLGTATPGARHVARFAASDADGDGALTEQEVGTRRWTHLRAADRNGDGKVTWDEADQARADGTLTPRGRGKGNGRSK